MIWRPLLAWLSNYGRVIRLLCQVKSSMSSSVIAPEVSKKNWHKCYAQETRCFWERLSIIGYPEQTRKDVLVDKICLFPLKQVVKSLLDISL